MSEKDFDWGDDLDFESLADEKEMEADYGEPEDSFADLDDLADYADPAGEADPRMAGADDGKPEDTGPETADPVTDDLPTEVPVPEPTKRMSGKNKNIVSPAGLGFLVASCTLVGALGLSGALLAAFGLDPAALWNPAGLTALDQIGNFHDHPLNLFYVVALGILLLTFMGAYTASRLAAKANQQVQRTQELLSKVTALRLEDEEPWTSREFNSDPDTSAFVADVLGAWRMLQARQVRSVGLEGELRRLEKAMRDNSREDLADRYDHPLVGTLADAMLGWYDDRDSARKEADAVREKDETESAEIMALIEDARGWNQTTRERVDVQGATLRRWSGKFEELAQRVEQDSGRNKGISGLQGLQKDLSRALEAADGDAQASLDDLVDRGSKLAFQIAMEVARLGPRGERLLPMSQSLEELTTQFRQTVSRAKSGGQEDATSPQAILTRLEQITVQLVKDSAGSQGNIVHTLQDLVPASRKLADNLDGISGSFNQQGTRLNTLGSTFADLAGLEFDPEKVMEGEPANPPEGGLNITQSDPFGKDKEDTESSLEVDPFAATDMQLPGEDAPPAAEISKDVTPGSEDVFNSGLSGNTNDFTQDTTPGPEPEPALSADEEKVYDLAEFGAVRIDQDGEQDAPAGEEGQDDRIYDLAEFGAVALN